MAETARKRKGKGKELPLHIAEQVDRLLVEGSSFEEIRSFLAEQGQDITKTTIGRYGAEFLECYRRLRVIEEKSRALASDTEDGLLLGEAASRLFTQMIIESQLDGKIELETLPKLLSDFARLQSSNVQRERLRREFRARVEKAAEEVGQKNRKNGLSEEAAEEIRRKILGIAE